jgi:methionyl-tRNA synthetase
MKPYYITTPIYYVNSKPHIGTALTTLAADITARYQRMRGREVMFLTGTDENAPKVAEAAERAGQSPQQFVDAISAEFQAIWHGLGIRYDDFIRTTEERHRKAVQEVFRRLHEKGDIYVGNYEGWYCVSCETFWRPNEVEDGLCPNPECRRPVNWVTEQNYFFKLSAYADRLIEHIKSHPRFILPEGRKNEVVRFIESGLRDACITRANNGWGIPVPGDDSMVIYVWFDALINYLAATGWPEKETSELWPPDVEWMGKDILVRFHATLWPAILMGLGISLPETLVGHGWMTIGGEKISKTKGNVVDPVQLATELAARAGCTQELAVDAVRYYMAREMPFASDTMFTQENFESRYNTELANDFGNAIHRSISMTHKFVDGIVPDSDADPAFTGRLAERVKAYVAAMDIFRLDQALDAAMGVVSDLNHYIDDMAPWGLAKSGDAVALGSVLRTMLETGRFAATLFSPFLPSTGVQIHKQLGFSTSGKWEETERFDLLSAGTKLPGPTPAFPRLQPPATETPTEEKKPTVPPISIDEFAKIELRVAEVLAAESVPGSDKLLKLSIQVGEENRTIAAGIAEYYKPDELVGKQIVVVANLKPAKIRGIESQGMMLAADGESGAIFLTPSQPAPSGARVH